MPKCCSTKVLLHGVVQSDTDKGSMSVHASKEGGITSCTTPDTTPLLVSCTVQPEALMAVW